MPKPFVKLTATEFEDLVDSFNFSRMIGEVHMHHTWRPNHGQYRGLPTIDSMWEFHTQTNGWSDIAQHVSIAPDGAIWTGRNWNRPPASAAGFNGNSDMGPFMFEMIGDFDTGKDSFTDPQKATVIRVIVALLKRFSLPVSALRFHNHMTNQKSCPGTSIDYTAFCKLVQTALSSTRAAAGGARKRGAPSPLVREVLEAMEVPVDVDLAAPEFRADHLHFPEEAFTTRGPTAGGAANAGAHLINLRDGRLSRSGVVTSSEASLEALFGVHLPEALAEARAEDRPVRLMFFAHGGLNGEKGAVEAALGRIPWWLSNGIYPVFFIWETGLMETWGQMLERATKDMWGGLGGLFGRRGVFDFVADHATDPAVEKIARSIGGVGTWGAMKNSARRASEEGSGGAWLTAKHLKEFLKTTKGHPVELHAVGHSAGSIFHAHFLAAVRKALGPDGPTIRTLHHLAPAIRVDLFKEKVLPLLGKGIDRLTMYTMTDAKEREDTCMKVYKKSLLYLIHHGLEPENRCPLVGMQQSVRADPTLRNLFEPESPGVAEVIWSPVGGGPRHSSHSVAHGKFDDDESTMNSVCRRILGRNDIKEYDVKSRGIAEVWSGEPTEAQIALGILTEHALRKYGAALPQVPDAAVPAPEAPAIVTRPAAGRRRALCIGIDHYPDPGDRLGGCVNDAREWERYFSANGFATTLMTDGQATYEGILGAFGELVSSAEAGDIIAIQYSAHGTQMDDLSGDEEDDGKDEALCCHDFRAGRLILDDELSVLFAKVSQGVHLSLFMDCCHAGTNNKAIGRLTAPLPEGAKRRYVHPSRELNDAHAAFRGSRPATRSGSGAKDIYANSKDLLFAASLPSQYANEIGGAGVFTRAAMRVLRANGGRGLSSAAFDEAVRAAFPPEFRAIQESRLYGPAGSKAGPFLGGL